MVLADYKGEMNAIVTICIITGFPGGLRDIGPSGRVRVTVSGEWNPLVETKAGNGTMLGNGTAASNANVQGKVAGAGLLPPGVRPDGMSVTGF